MRLKPALAAAVLLAAGCSSTASKPAPASATAPTGVAAPATPTGASTAPQTPAAAKATGIGDTVELKSTKAGNVLDVTVVKIVDPAGATDEFTTPDPGKRYVAVQLRLANKGKDVYDQNPRSLLKARDAAGETFGASFGTDTKAGQSMDPSLRLAPGDSTLGFLTFAVPTGQKITRLQYTLSSLGGTVAAWTIG